MAYSTGK